MKKEKKNFTVISLFSGCGGMDLGFIQAGFEVIWANDFFDEAVATYKKNISEDIILGDIKKIKNSTIPYDADVLLGGFPCQGFSIANNKRNRKDKRNFLYREMLRIIKARQPKFFVAENVKGILSLHKGEVFKMILEDFRSIGYKVEYKLLKASDYGVPQHRERVFIIGNRVGLNNKYPKITHGIYKGLKPYVKTKDAIGHLADVRLSYKPIKVDGEIYFNHIARTNVHEKFWGRKHDVNQHEICDYLKKWKKRSGLSTSKIDDIFGYKYTAGHWFRKDNNSGSIPKPKDWWKLKELLGFDDKFDKQVTEMELKPIEYEQSLRINNWDEPSDTITASGPEIHPNKERRLSVRECAILQTFPNDFVFVGSLSKMYKQIGNAVPVLLARKIAEQIKSELEKL
jgi:DNA (cytosine-5)-methyltransferase 1